MPLKAHETNLPKRRIGFFGCNGKVIRLENTGRRGPMVVDLEKCPGCGHGHKAKPFWRRWQRELDDGVETLKV